MSEAEDILSILERLAAGELDVAGVLALAGGREWYIPSPRRMEQQRRRAAIAADRRTDARVVARAHHVSVSLVYEVWNERLAS